MWTVRSLLVAQEQTFKNHFIAQCIRSPHPILNSIRFKSNKSSSSTPVAHTDFDIDQFSNSMARIGDNCKQSFTQLKLSRADSGTILGIDSSSGILEKIIVTHQRKSTPLSEMADIQLSKPPTAWLIHASESSWLPLIEKAIRKSDPNLNPQKVNDYSLKVMIPKGTASFKESLLKNAKELAESNRVQIRNVRSEARTTLKKAGLSVDVTKRMETRIQDTTDKYIKVIESLLAQKTKEIQKI